MRQLVGVHHLGACSLELLGGAPLTFIDGVIFVDHKILQLSVVMAASIQALHFVIGIAILVVGLRACTHFEVVLGYMRQIFGMEIAMSSPRPGHIHAERHVGELLNDGEGPQAFT